MAFVVTHMDDGITNRELEHYFRLLEKRGVDWANTGRIHEQDSNRWFPIWEQKSDAELFAKELSVETNNNWDVIPCSEEQISHGPLGPLDVYINRQSAGCSYALHINSSKLVRKRFPHAHQISGVFAQYDTLSDFESVHRPIWDQMVLMLTGLTRDELAEFGGYRLYDPKKNEVVFVRSDQEQFAEH